jgi:hypothetical protein
MTEAATKKLTELRLVQNEMVNKNRVERKFQVNDIVFISLHNGRRKSKSTENHFKS